MKKILYLLLLLPLLTVFGGCSGLEDIVFEHEVQLFPIKDNAILLEVIMPTGSLVDDEYYIVGDFNGGKEEAVDNPVWRLEKAGESNLKWGIYLTPSSFIDGKSLADGFTFYAKKQGSERTVKNDPVEHSLNVSVGSFTNVWIDRWESYFGQPEKDSYSIYVNDQTGWNELSLYVWGDMEVAGWPGISPTSSEVINDVTYTVFDMGKEAKDKKLNFIFNNNNNGKQFDAMQDFTLNRDVYILITDKSFEEVDPDAKPYYGYTVYVDDQTDWDELALYTWGDIELASWPGIQPTGIKEINGVTFTYFEMGEDANDANLNLIFNNNGNNIQLKDISVALNRDFYFQITASGGVEIDPEGGGPIEEGYKIYIEDNSGWDAIALHYWGDGVTGTDWPGIATAGTEEINGITYKFFELPTELNDKSINTIFNNSGAGIQFDGPTITIDKNYTFLVTAESATEITPKGYKIYVEDNSGWDAIALHYWGDGVTGTDWPGIATAGTEEINGITYKFFELPTELNDKSINTIFNNSGAGIQFDGPTITIDKNYTFLVTAESATEITPKGYKIYVEDNSGWDAIALHYWGDGVTGTDWPGIATAGTEEINGIKYKFFELPAELNGKSINTIFNNNGAGIQFDGPYISINKNYYLKITSNSFEEVLK